MTLHFVELCCGTGAVSLRALGLKRIVPYMGNKHTYAPEILELLEVTAAPDRFTWADSGEWGWTNHTMFDLRLIPRVIKQLDFWRHDDDRELFERLRHAPVPADAAARAAVHVYLQARSYNGKPVRPGTFHDTRTWVTHGFDPEHRMSSSPRGNPRGWANSRPTLMKNLQQLHDGTAGVDIRVKPFDVRSMTPVALAEGERGIVYFDPNYQGRTGYGAGLMRAEVRGIALQWVAAGYRVAVSEGEALPGLVLQGWKAHQLHGTRKRPHNWSKQEEWLTISPEAS